MMGKHFTLTIFACLIFYACAVSEPRRCDFFGKGVVCEEQNLIGYYECDGTDSFGAFSACGPKQICSCGFDRKCSDGKPFCVDRSHFTSQQVPSDFTVSFNGVVNTSFPQGFNREILSGAIWMDSTEGDEKQRVLVSRKRMNGKEFERQSRITIRKDGIFVLYTFTQRFNESSPQEQVINQLCTQSTVTINEAITFYDLRRFAVKDSSRKDEYVLRNGPSFPQGGFTEKRWRFGKTHFTQPYVPVSFRRFQQGSPISKTTTSLELRYHYFYTGKPDVNQFRIPEICKKYANNGRPADGGK
ncbi:uncharacterized protein [Clytia hemisphaerica]|uniref:SMB domain-containing protein n=1 Tax=Clytia hemisphaerica TaxID=252671 RepID=A0A7M5US78_9CNID